MAKIYVAASWKRMAHARALAGKLREAGHEVQARWMIQAEGIVGEAAYVQSEAVMAQSAADDMADVGAVGCMVVITGDAANEASRGGKHTELGIALAMGKRIYVLGPPEQVYHWHPAVRRLAGVDELLDELYEVSNDPSGD